MSRAAGACSRRRDDARFTTLGLAAADDPQESCDQSLWERNPPMAEVNNAPAQIVARSVRRRRDLRDRPRSRLGAVPGTGPHDGPAVGDVIAGARPLDAAGTAGDGGPTGPGGLDVGRVAAQTSDYFEGASVNR
jgi:hypothetical protein